MKIDFDWGLFGFSNVGYVAAQLLWGVVLVTWDSKHLFIHVRPLHWWRRKGEYCILIVPKERVVYANWYYSLKKGD